MQHLLGSGHLVRMRALARVLANGGHCVTLISGGLPLDHFEDEKYVLLQLPPIKTEEGNFSTLLQADSTPVSADFKQHRSSQLLEQVAQDSPDVLIIETFPFGRRALRFELVPLLKMVKKMNPRPLTICSLRDILQLRTAERYQQTVDEVDAWFDYLLVHADPTVATLEETFPLAKRFEEKIVHTNYVYERRYVASGRAAEHSSVENEVIVSAGGGAVGFRLLETAIAAQRHSCLKTFVWRILVGRSMTASRFALLKKQADRKSKLIVEWNRPDFIELLEKCVVSVSQSGYNTVIDTIVAGCRSVFVPFSQYGETEQRHRAEKFSNLRRAIMLPEDALNPKQLAFSIDRAAELDLSKCLPIRVDGAMKSRLFIEQIFANKIEHNNDARLG